MSWMKISAAAGAAAMLALFAAPVLADQPVPAAKAQPATQSDVAATPKAADAPAKKLTKREAELKKIVCRTEPVAGSRIPKRTCRTQAEWRELQKNSRERTKGLQDQSDMYGRPGG